MTVNQKVEFKEKTSTLHKLKSQQAKLEAKIRLMEARSKVSERKKETRRKILLGSYYLEQARQSGNMQNTSKLMDGYLKRDSDRALFDLEPLEKSESQTTQSE